MDTQQFTTDVYEIVRQIPAGRVLTYGDVARLAGFPNHSRLVGHVMAGVPHELGLPCQRVVNASGRLVPNWPQQADLLRSEGVAVVCGKNGEQRVNLKRWRWEVMNTV